MFDRLREDIACILERDPAARSKLEILTCYPGLHAILIHRLAHRFWRSGWYWLGRFTSHIGRMLTGIEIHPGAKIGRRVFIDHGLGVVIGETAVVGDDCTIYQGVTLGGTKLYKGAKRHPTLGKGVVVGAGAQVLGGFEVGDGARIGSNAVVVKPVPAGATAVGNPARIIERQSSNTNTDTPATKPVQAQASTSNLGGCCSEGNLDTQPLHEILNHQQQRQDEARALQAAAAEADSNDASRQFSAYAVDSTDTDPLIKVVQELINHTAKQDARITQLCQAIESLGKKIDAPENGTLDAQRLNKLVE